MLTSEQELIRQRLANLIRYIHTGGNGGNPTADQDRIIEVVLESLTRQFYSRRTNEKS